MQGRCNAYDMHDKLQPSLLRLLSAIAVLGTCLMPALAVHQRACCSLQHRNCASQLTLQITHHHRSAGVGFSVEPRCVAQLPVVAERFVQTSSTVVVEDSREGWARALREIIALLYTGHVSLLLAAAQLHGMSCAATGS